MKTNKTTLKELFKELNEWFGWGGGGRIDTRKFMKHQPSSEQQKTKKDGNEVLMRHLMVSHLNIVENHKFLFTYRQDEMPAT